MFQLVETPVALPGSCYLCGSGEKSPYIDWGVSIDYHGALYTCHECTESVANLLGMTSKAKSAMLLSMVDQLTSENQDLWNQNIALKDAIRAMKAAGYNEPIPDTDDQLSFAVTDLASSVLAIPEIPNEPTREASKLLDLGAGTLDEPSDDEGVDELHSDDKSTSYEFRI